MLSVLDSITDDELMDLSKIKDVAFTYNSTGKVGMDDMLYLLTCAGMVGYLRGAITAEEVYFEMKGL